MDVQISEWATAGSTPEITIERLKLNVIFRQIQAVEFSQIFHGIENHSTTRIITQEFEAFLVEAILLVEVFLINYGNLKFREIGIAKIDIGIAAMVEVRIKQNSYALFFF